MPISAFLIFLYRVYAIFNKDRFLSGLEPNRQIGDDIISGNIYIVAINEDTDELRQISEEQLKMTAKNKKYARILLK